MITQGFDFIAVIFGLCGLVVGLESRFKVAFFRWFPSIVLVMFGSMALYTLGLWEFSEEVRVARETVRARLCIRECNLARVPFLFVSFTFLLC